MKKLIVVLCFLLIALGALAYFIKSPFSLRTTLSEENADSLDVVQTGTIKSLGTFAVPDAGTHFLEDDSGTTYLLSGLGANLDLFVGQKVTVRGHRGRTPSGKELIQVIHIDQVIIPEGTTAVAPSPTDKQWSALSNTSLGVSFKKRNHWNFSIDGQKITFTLPGSDTTPCTAAPLSAPEGRPGNPTASCAPVDDDSLFIQRLKNPEKQNLDAFLLSKNKTPVKSKIGVDGLDGLKLVYDSGLIEFYLQRENFIYVIAYQPSKVNPGSIHENDFYQLLSTFRFIPIN